MKKHASFLLGAALMLTALALAGCHGSRGLEPFEKPESFDEAKPLEISFWAKNDTNKAQALIYEKAISDFEKLYPNITVNIRLYTDYGKIYNDVITNIATNTTPDVCISYPDHIATYLSGTNIVVPLEELFGDASYGLGGSELKFDSPTQSEIIPQFLDECAFGGHYYALPFMRSTEACYINKTFVEKLGYTLPEKLTWDFVWEVSEAAVKKDSAGNFPVNGQKVMIPFIYKSTDNMMIQMLRQKNAGYSDGSGNILIFNGTTREILETVAAHAATGAFSTFKISSYPANFLNAGQCIFAIDSTAGATWMGTDAPLLDIAADKVVKFETEVMAIPQYDPSSPKMISQGPSVCIFNKKDPQQVMAAWLFAQYLLTNDVQTAYSETEGYVPVTSKAQNSPEYLDYLARSGEDSRHYEIKIKAARLLMENTDNTFVTPVFNGSASLRDASGYLIESVTKSVRRKTAVDGAFIDRLFEDASALYRLDQSRAGMNSGEKINRDLGALPGPARALLISLGAVWAVMAAYLIFKKIKKKRA